MYYCSTVTSWHCTDCTALHCTGTVALTNCSFLCSEYERSRRCQSLPGQERRGTSPYSQCLSKSDSRGLTSSPHAHSPEPLTTPTLLTRGGLHHTPRRSWTPTRKSATPRTLASEPLRFEDYDINSAPEKNIEDTFKPMWTWYYGHTDQTSNRISLAARRRQKPRPSSLSSSFDLTEALDPEWYFRWNFVGTEF